jgi:hypothetical protein
MRLRHLIMLALLAGAWAAMPASGGYLVDSRGAAVRNNYGECWRTGSWTPTQAIAECDPDLVIKSAPRAEPAPALRSELGAEPRAAAPAPAPAKLGVKAQAGVTKNGGGYPGAERAMVPLATSMGLFSKTVNILEHHWTPILSKGEEARSLAGFGMYTYVLFGRDPSDSGLDKAISARYDATLSAVLQSPAESSNPSSMQTRGATNLFCLPANQHFVSEPKFDRTTYDFPLAQQYLTDFRFLLAGNGDILPRLVSDAGPFLIATLRPLGSIVKTEGGQMKIADSKAPILFIDLTHTHHQVIAEMVDAFKLEVIDISLDHHQRFRSLRVALIDLLKKADDQVTPVRQASAGFMPKEEKKKEPTSKP